MIQHKKPIKKSLLLLLVLVLISTALLPPLAYSFQSGRLIYALDNLEVPADEPGSTPELGEAGTPEANSEENHTTREAAEAEFTDPEAEPADPEAEPADSETDSADPEAEPAESETESQTAEQSESESGQENAEDQAETESQPSPSEPADETTESGATAASDAVTSDPEEGAEELQDPALDYDNTFYQIRLRASLDTQGMDLTRLLGLDSTELTQPYLPLTAYNAQGLLSNDPWLAEEGFYLPLDSNSYYPAKRGPVRYTDLKGSYSAPLYEQVQDTYELSYRLRPFGLPLAEDPAFASGAIFGYGLNLAALSSPLLYAHVLGSYDYQAACEALTLRENVRQGLVPASQPELAELLRSQYQAGGENPEVFGLRYLEALESEEELLLTSLQDLHSYYFAGLQLHQTPEIYPDTGAQVYDYLLNLRLQQVASSQITVRWQEPDSLALESSASEDSGQDLLSNPEYAADTAALASPRTEEEVVLPLSFETVSRTKLLPDAGNLQLTATGEPFQGIPVFRLEDLDFTADNPSGLYRLELPLEGGTISLSQIYGDPDASERQKLDPSYPVNPTEAEARVLRAQNLMDSQADLPRLLLGGQSTGILELPMIPANVEVSLVESSLNSDIPAPGENSPSAQAQRLLYRFEISYDPLEGALVEFTRLEDQLDDHSLVPDQDVAADPSDRVGQAAEEDLSDAVILLPQSPEPTEGYVRLSFISGADAVPYPLASLSLTSTLTQEKTEEASADSSDLEEAAVQETTPLSGQNTIVYDVRADLTWEEALHQGLIVPDVVPLEESFLRPLQAGITWMSLPEAAGHSQALVQGDLLGLPLPDSFDQRTLAEILDQATAELARANHERQSRLLEEPEYYQTYPELPSLAEHNLAFYAQYEPVIEGAESPEDYASPAMALRASSLDEVEVGDKRFKAAQIMQQTYPYLANRTITSTSGLRYSAVRYRGNGAETDITIRNEVVAEGEREVIYLDECSWFSTFSYYGFGGQRGSIVYLFEDPAFAEAIDSIYLNFDKFGVESNRENWRPFTEVETGVWSAPTQYHCTALGTWYVSDVKIILKAGKSLDVLTRGKPVTLDHAYFTQPGQIDLKSVQNTTLINAGSADNLGPKPNPSNLPVIDMETAWGWPKGGVFSNNVYYLTEQQLIDQSAGSRPELMGIFTTESGYIDSADADLTNGVIVSDHIISYTEPFETTQYFWEVIIKEEIPPEILPFIDTSSICLVGRDSKFKFYQYGEANTTKTFDSSKIDGLCSMHLDKQEFGGDKTAADYNEQAHRAAFVTARGNLTHVFGIASGFPRFYHTCYRLKSNADLVAMISTSVDSASPEVAKIQERVTKNSGWTSATTEEQKARIIMEEFQNFLHDKTGATPSLSSQDNDPVVNTNHPIWKSWQESYWPSFSKGAFVAGDSKGIHRAYIKESYATGYIQTDISEIDTDMDGIPDYLERLIGTDPYNPDTDWDGVPDGQEYYYDLTNPLDVREFKPPVPLLDHEAILNDPANVFDGCKVQEDADGNLWFPETVPDGDENVRHTYKVIGSAPKVHYQDPLWLYGERTEDGSDYANPAYKKYNLGQGDGWDWSLGYTRNKSPQRVFNDTSLEPCLTPVYKGGDGNYYLGYHPLAAGYVVKLEVSRYQPNNPDEPYSPWEDWNSGGNNTDLGGVDDGDYSAYANEINSTSINFYQMDKNNKTPFRTSGWNLIGNVLKTTREANTYGGRTGFVVGKTIPRYETDPEGRTPRDVIDGNFIFQLYVDFQDEPKADLKNKDRLRLVAYPPLWRNARRSDAIYGWGSMQLDVDPYRPDYKWPMAYPGKPYKIPTGSLFTPGDGDNYFVGGRHLWPGRTAYMLGGQETNMRRSNKEYKYKPNPNFDFNSRSDTQKPWLEEEVDVNGTTITLDTATFTPRAYQWATRFRVIGETFYIGSPEQKFIRIVPNAFGEYAREGSSGKMVTQVAFSDNVTSAENQPFNDIADDMVGTTDLAPIVVPKALDYDGQPLRLFMENGQPQVFYSFDFEGKYNFTAADAANKTLGQIANDVQFAGTIDTIYVNYVKRVDKLQGVDYGKEPLGQSQQSGEIYAYDYSDGATPNHYLWLPNGTSDTSLPQDEANSNGLKYEISQSDNHLTLDIIGTCPVDSNNLVVDSPRLNLIINSKGGANAGDQVYAPIVVRFYPKVIENPPEDFASDEYVYLTFDANDEVSGNEPPINDPSKNYRGKLTSRKNETLSGQAQIVYAIHKEVKWIAFRDEYLPIIVPNTKQQYDLLARTSEESSLEAYKEDSKLEKNWNFNNNPTKAQLTEEGKQTHEDVPQAGLLHQYSIQAWNRLANSDSNLNMLGISEASNPITGLKYGTKDGDRMTLPTLYAQYKAPTLPPTGLELDQHREIISLALSAGALMLALVYFRKH